MKELELVLLLMALLTGLSAVATRFRLPYPVLLVVAGLVLALVPGLPVLRLNPDLIFLIFLPPLLYEASFSLSWTDFKTYHRPITWLAVGLVLFTTVLVAGLAHYFIPGFRWPLAFVLGAIVSPPDAVAATSAVQGLGLPRRITAILEGEGLVNDASALIIYRSAVAAVVGGSFAFWQAGWQFLLVGGGGIGIGLAIGYLVTLVQARITDSTLATSLTLLVPYVAYSLAEQVGVSGVLAVVFTGLVVSWRSYDVYSTTTRLQNTSFWNVLVFLLNGFVFIVIGLQLPTVLQDLHSHRLTELIGYGLLISAATILVRIAWVFPTFYLAYRHKRPTNVGRSQLLRELFIISWSGMRGIISLATALALPLVLSSGHPFPQRSAILLITFIVILTTLVLQSLSLPWLIRWLGVREPAAELTLEEQRLRLEVASGVLAYLDDYLAHHAHSAVLDTLRQRVARRISYLNNVLANAATTPLEEDLTEREQFSQLLQMQLEVNAYQRRLLAHLHHEGNFSEQAIREVERELDSQDVSLHLQLRGAQQ